MIMVSGCTQPRVAEVYPHLTEYSGRLIDDLEFVNPDPFTTDTLDALTTTEATHCRLLNFLPFCFPGTDWGLQQRRLDLPTVGADLERLNRLYRQSGFFGTRVEPEVLEPEGDDGPIHLKFMVDRGDPIIVESISVEGTEGIADPDSITQEALPLEDGERFDLLELVASADTVVEILRRHGHAYAEVLRNYAVDTLQDRATVVLVAVPGPRVVVDSLIVSGNVVLDRETVLRQVVVQEGNLLQRRELIASQRNLYELEMVQFAAVSVAPDTVQLTPDDSATATLIVQVVEAPEHVVEASVGFGSEDCAQTSGQWTDRSFTGGARRLSVTGSLSRIPSLICDSPEVEEDLPFTSRWDYRLAAELRQPFFLNPRNSLLLTAFAEQQSQPGLFQRTAQGGRLSLSHRAGSRELITAALESEHREILAAPALLCAAFSVCTPEQIQELGQFAWRNALTATWVRDAGFPVVDPTRGYTLNVDAMWSSSLLLSDYEFLRLNGEGALYREIREGWVLAGFLRLGSFVTGATLGSDDDFVPPEERFYTGGASSVRGYARSQLGPGIWLYQVDSAEVVVDTTNRELDVDFYPTGGTSVAVASVEARFPSPFLDDLLDMAAFVDAGTIGYGRIWDLTSQWRVTPGAGLRISTPVGPVRVDLAYNPYPYDRGPLYVQNVEEGTIRQVAESYRRADPSLLQRLQLHIGLGQAF